VTRAIALYRLAIAVLAVCLLVTVVGYQSARRQADDARAAATLDHRYREVYHNALTKLQSERYDAGEGKRAVARLVARQQEEQTYTRWLERQLVHYEAGDPQQWRASAENQARKEFRESWDAHQRRWMQQLRQAQWKRAQDEDTVSPKTPPRQASE
jgi:hypothetical protein